ncbi:alpha/beta fold hydrolase [Streptomyces sp. NPDC059153]|uniref:alpha/beta fold hydrolase n=1 Tax=Streptomyces sp. NPDC059153 TaxID=3346743 RepID=UPI0036CF69DA
MTAAAAVGAAGLSGAGQASAVTGTAAVKAPTGRAAYGLGPVRRTRTDVLDIAYHDVGPAHGKPVILLHGWLFSPVSSYAEVAPSPGADTAATSSAACPAVQRRRCRSTGSP